VTDTDIENQVLELAVIDVVRSRQGKRTMFCDIYCAAYIHKLVDELHKMYPLTERARFVDRALQRLRRRNVIAYDGKTGWREIKQAMNCNGEAPP
jgi:hypothetical protein